MNDIQLEAVGRGEETVLQNLLQLYTHDFSVHWAGTPKGELDALGRYPDFPLEPYWTGERHTALLVRVHGQIAGFALINDSAHGGEPVDANVAEFFVVRKYRRGGIGTQVAHALFDMRPGIWEAAIARKNVTALTFWRTAVRSHPRTTNIDERDMTCASWNGPVLRFEIG